MIIYLRIKIYELYFYIALCTYLHNTYVDCSDFYPIFSSNFQKLEKARLRWKTTILCPFNNVERNELIFFHFQLKSILKNLSALRILKMAFNIQYLAT